MPLARGDMWLAYIQNNLVAGPGSNSWSFVSPTRESPSETPPPGPTLPQTGSSREHYSPLSSNQHTGIWRFNLMTRCLVIKSLLRTRIFSTTVSCALFASPQPNLALPSGKDLTELTFHMVSGTVPKAELEHQQEEDKGAECRHSSQRDLAPAPALHLPPVQP